MLSIELDEYVHPLSKFEKYGADFAFLSASFILLHFVQIGNFQKVHGYLRWHIIFPSVSLLRTKIC